MRGLAAPPPSGIHPDGVPLTLPRMTEQTNTLRIWAEIETQTFINSIRTAPDDLRQDRAVMARHFGNFVRQAVFPIVADAGTKLAGLLVELEKETSKEPDKRGHCEHCRAAQLVETLATAFYAQMKGGRA